MRNTTRNIYIAIMGVILCMVLIGCNLDFKEEKPRLEPHEELLTLRVSVQPFFLSTQLQYIIENELDIKAGLDIELVFSEDGNAQIEEEAMKQWDVATIGGAFVYSLAENQAVLIADIIKSSDSNNIYAKAGHEVFDTVGFNPTYPDVYGSPGTVKESTIYINENTTSQYIANKWLASIGVRVENVIIEKGSFQQCYENLQGNEQAFSSLAAPYSFLAPEQGYDIVASATDLNIPFYEVIIANKSCYEDKKEEIGIFVQLMLEAGSVLEDNRRLKIENATDWYGVNGEYKDETYLDTIAEECRLKQYVTPYNYNYEEFGQFADGYASFLAQNGSIEAEDLVNVRNNMDGEIFENAMESILENK